MTRIGIIIGSTRRGRNSEQVAHWVHAQAVQRTDATYELIDLAKHPLPHLDEPMSAMSGRYQNAHTKEWAEVIGSYDGFVIVTPEYNHSTSGVLKNAIDYLYAEWNNKAVGFVSYGVAGGVRAVEHLRLVAGELMLADVKTNVALSMFHDFEGFSRLTPSETQNASLAKMLDELVAWTNALQPLREATLRTV